jgi:hypothetical protein
MPAAHLQDYPGVALSFVQALAGRDYPAAYAMTSGEYRRRTTMADMQSAFEAIVPANSAMAASVEVGLTMETWPDKHPSDVGWAYVSIGGDVYSEAVIVVVAQEAETLRIRTVEFGRP